MILYKSIPFRILLLFNIKNIFSELVFLILNFILLLASSAFGFISSFYNDGSSLVKGFNFYVLFYLSCLLFILILRMVQFFYHNKIEDKTIYITLSNQVSRTKLFLTQWFLMLLICWINMAIAFILINLLNFSLNGFTLDYLLLRITTTFLIYGILISFFLINFIIFLIFIFSLQTTTIICTLILSFVFISNLPVNFQKSNEKNMTIKFSNNQLLTISDLYEVFDFQKYVNDNHIKYNFLSKYINDNFLEYKFDFNSFNSSEQNINNRINDIWSSLGIVNKDSIEIEQSDLTIRSLPKNDSNIPDTWKAGNSASINLTLKNTFITFDELKNLIETEQDTTKKQILQDLYNFSLYIEDQYSNMQVEKANLFNEFIFIDDEKSIIKNTTTNSEIKLDKKYLISLYNYELNGTYKEDFTLGNNSNTYELVRNKLNFPLMTSVRILEQYFIKYTSRYILATEKSVILNEGDWGKYEKSRNNLQIYLYLNFFNGMWTNYTYNAGFSYNDFWFYSYSESKIVFEEQKNLFLGYTEYKLNLNEKNQIYADTYKKNVKPYLYVVILFAFSMFNLIFTIFKFKRKDLS
ncbi:ABC transporter permease [Spiroplasma floricola]|uniref:ABC transporter permease n=1 Tax=Spiroplasma floricola 23-6 TaxID=1336749 RepID=A0A2K8SDD3_9MOLU|nr:ABC transporter permease [Spiroplasma floricola]AUB31471.1 ABC transporter permease [Spiroplasma floricola 23-6]